ncbi:MAG: DMT family transporter [Anaeromyxobacter sp.]
MADLALLVLTLFWGTTFLLVNRVLGVASPGVFLAARFGLAALALAPVALWRRDRVGPGFLRHGILLGLFMLGGFALQTHGLAYTTPSRSGFITGLSVVIVPFVARFFLKKRVRPAYWVGAALAVVGLAVLTRLYSDGISSAVRLGDLLTLGCALVFTLQIVFVSEWAPLHPLAPLVLVQVLVTFAGALAMLPFEQARLDPAGMGTFLPTVAFTGLAMTAAAFFVMNWAQRRTTAVRAALIYSLEPVAAALFSHLVGGETLGVADWTGGGLIVLGVLVGELGGAWEDRAALTGSP